MPHLASWKFLCQHPAHLIAFGLGSGLSPKAPGTMGSLCAIPLYWLLTLMVSPITILWISLIGFVIGCWAADKTSKALGVHDHGGIVIDEIIAMWVVLAIAPQTWIGMMLSFVIFRIFDILKPWPIRWFDQYVHGGFGIMLDDMIAAGLSIFVVLVLIG